LKKKGQRTKKGIFQRDVPWRAPSALRNYIWYCCCFSENLCAQKFATVFFWNNFALQMLDIMTLLYTLINAI